MNAIISNEGELQFLKAKLDGEDVILRLFINDYTPQADDTIADYTEMSTLNYSAKTVDKTDWTYGTDGTGKGTATNILKHWNAFAEGTPVTVYGAYIEDASNKLIGAERFVNSIVIGTAGEVGEIKITPYYGAKSENT